MISFFCSVPPVSFLLPSSESQCPHRSLFALTLCILDSCNLTSTLCSGLCGILAIPRRGQATCFRALCVLGSLPGITCQVMAYPPYTIPLHHDTLCYQHSWAPQYFFLSSLQKVSEVMEFCLLPPFQCLLLFFPPVLLTRMLGIEYEVINYVWNQIREKKQGPFHGNLVNSEFLKGRGALKSHHWFPAPGHEINTE